jgi:hypothetical protein
MGGVLGRCHMSSVSLFMSVAIAARSMRMSIRVSIFFLLKLSEPRRNFERDFQLNYSYSLKYTIKGKIVELSSTSFHAGRLAWADAWIGAFFRRDKGVLHVRKSRREAGWKTGKQQKRS